MLSVGERVVYVNGARHGVPYGPIGTILARRREAPRFLVRFDAVRPFPGVPGQEHWCDDDTLVSARSSARPDSQG